MFQPILTEEVKKNFLNGNADIQQQSQKLLIQIR